VAVPFRQPPPPPTRSPSRTLGDILFEIGRRSPADLHAFEVLARHVLQRLIDDQQAPRGEPS
jgi:hypothetical protein